MSVNKSKATFEIEQCWTVAVLLRPFWKWRPVEIFRCQESIRDIIIYLHMKCRWNRTILNLCGIVAAILKMATARNFWMSGINSGHHNQYRESIWDIIIYPQMKCRWNRTMLNLCGIVAAILKMATVRNFSILMISENVEFLPPIFYAVFWQPFWKW